jgi:signal transduction histidine kinase/ActR/RegA family two-component response regulator
VRDYLRGMADRSFSLSIAGASEAYRNELIRRVNARLPIAVLFLLATATIATVFEVLRFPERRGWMLAADGAMLVLGTIAVGVSLLRPQRVIVVTVVVVNLLGLVLNAYHAVVGAQLGLCIWTLTALLGSAVVFLPWGWKGQAMSSLGALLGYGLMTLSPQADGLVWAAGGVYLVVMVGMSVVAAGLIERYIAIDFSLSRTLSDREARLEQLLADEQSARLAAEAANRVKDEFLATVSHELRTPLTPILGWVRQLRDGGLSPAEERVALGTIERAGSSLVQLIDDLLDVSRITSGKLRLQPRPVEIVRVVAAAIEPMRPAAAAKGITLDVSTVEGLTVAGDPERLQQIVWNLVSNAIKFTDSGGRVKVDVSRVDAEVEIRVSDTGQGISEELLPHVFERFWQADGSSTRTFGGLGLGLAIVRHLVELHGGTVHAGSPGVGLGSIFRVRLPASTSPGTVVPPPTANAIGLLAGLSALVVDDESDGKDMVRVLLERKGIEVRTASSASQALELLDEWVPDVVISDLAMPQQDGFALIRAIRLREATRGGRVAALAFTARAAAEDRTRALAAGFDGYLAKPADPDALLALVAHLATPAIGAGTPASG